MAINFPSSPIDGQVFYDSASGNRYVYKSSLSAWKYAANNSLEGVANTQVVFNKDGSFGGSNSIEFYANTLYLSNVFVSENVTATYYYGNGAFLTGIATDLGAANNWANTKLSNTSNVWFDGNLNISQDLFIGRNITNVTQVIFNTGTNLTPTVPGAVTWSQDDSTLHFDMDSPNNVVGHIGQDLFYYVKNQTGSTINKGQVVRFAGTVGASGRLLIAPAIANNSYPSKYIMGVAAASILDGNDGFVIAQGKIRGIDTSMFSAGDILYVSPTTPGGFSNTMPSAPNNKVTIAAVINKDNTQGSIEVRVTLGSKINEDELAELNGLTNGDILSYVSANGRFENSQALVNGLAAANNWANNISTAGNNYSTAVGSSANAYALATSTGIGTAGNNYSIALTTAGNNYALGTATSIGTAGNNYTVAVAASANINAGFIANNVGSGANNYLTAIDTAGNNYALGTATSIGTAGNNYTISVAASANNWANTKLANTSGITFNGDFNTSGNLSAEGTTFFVNGITNRVGIGRNDPGYGLDVVGTVNVTALLVNGAALSGGATLTNETASSSTYYPVFTTATSGSMTVANTSNTKLYFVPSTGTLSATIFNSLSDRNLKDNIKSFDGRTLIDLINPVSFNWKDNGNKSYGVIAQDLEQVMPELVETNEQGIKSVSYIPLIAILVDVIKRQEEEIKEIKQRLNMEN